MTYTDPTKTYLNRRMVTDPEPVPLTSNDAGRQVTTPAGIGILQGVAEIPGEGRFASVRVANSRVVYEVERVTLVDDGASDTIKSNLEDAGFGDFGPM